MYLCNTVKNYHLRCFVARYVLSRFPPLLMKKCGAKNPATENTFKIPCKVDPAGKKNLTLHHLHLPNKIFHTGNPGVPKRGWTKNAQLSQNWFLPSQHSLWVTDGPHTSSDSEQQKDEQLGFKDSRISLSCWTSYRGHWGLAAKKTKWDSLHNSSGEL